MGTGMGTFPDPASFFLEAESVMADWGPVLIAVVLFVLLTPGLLFQVPGKNRVVEFGSMHTSGASILVHTIIYFGLITIFLIAIGVHIYTDLQTLASICFKNRGNCMIRKPVPHALKNRGLDDVNLWRSTPQLPTWHYP
ncbi:unnamed protein product, partial [Vitis vinifera]|uniref:Uncharacterized protein n=2 Tax=Vitis vinifera TaxID=29760 RepID=D7SH02_VITVI